MSSNLSLNNVGFQNNLRSKPVRENFTDIENNFNSLRSEVYASIASTAAEVVNARHEFSALTDNVSIRRVYGNGVATGGLALESNPADDTFTISAGEGICPNGIGVDWSSEVVIGISAVSKPRYMVAVVNSDNSVSVELGATSDDPILPVLSSTQQPLSIIYQDTASPPVFASANMVDARYQGCHVHDRYFFRIQDSVDFANSTLGGRIDVGRGNYYEEIDMAGKNNLTLNMDARANIYRPSDSEYCLKSVNTAGSVTDGNRIKGGSFLGNDKTGNKELVNIQFTDKFLLAENSFDGNTLSTATYKNLYIDECDTFKLTRNLILDDSGVSNMNTYRITATCTDFTSDDQIYLFSLIM